MLYVVICCYMLVYGGIWWHMVAKSLKNPSKIPQKSLKNPSKSLKSGKLSDVWAPFS